MRMPYLTRSIFFSMFILVLCFTFHIPVYISLEEYRAAKGATENANWTGAKNFGFVGFGIIPKLQWHFPV